MDIEPTGLQQRITAGKPLLLAEISPPQGGDPAVVRDVARRLAGKFHAVGVSDNRDHVAMSALAAATLVAAEGVEPILHVVTRDRNRIALVSDALGRRPWEFATCCAPAARTRPSGRSARPRAFSTSMRCSCSTPTPTWPKTGRSSANSEIAGAGPFCLGGVASPNADPLELQVLAAGQEGRQRGRVPDHAAGFRPGSLRRLVAGSQPPRAPLRRWPSWPAFGRSATARRPPNWPQTPPAADSRGRARAADRAAPIARRSGPPASRSPSRRSSGCGRSRGCGASRSAWTATWMPPWK